MCRVRSAFSMEEEEEDEEEDDLFASPDAAGQVHPLWNLEITDNIVASVAGFIYSQDTGRIQMGTNSRTVTLMKEQTRTRSGPHERNGFITLLCAASQTVIDAWCHH